MRDLSCADTRVYLDLEVRRVCCRACGRVKRERLDFLAGNPLCPNWGQIYFPARVFSYNFLSASLKQQAITSSNFLSYSRITATAIFAASSLG